MHDGIQCNFLLAALGATRVGMYDLLANAIDDLPERERLVFTLYYYEELQTSEIALIPRREPYTRPQLYASVLSRLTARLTAAERRVIDAELHVPVSCHLQ